MCEGSEKERENWKVEGRGFFAYTANSEKVGVRITGGASLRDDLAEMGRSLSVNVSQ